jgi:hypothetical protein
MSRTIDATKVLLEDRDLLESAARVGQGRGNNTLAKTVRDLLRERLIELQIKGDPLAIRPEPDAATKPARAA